MGDWVTLGGFAGVHQFVHVGAHVMAGIHSVLTQDVPPYMLLGGTPAVPHGINAEGLRRRGFGPERIAALRRAYRVLYRQGLALEQAVEQLGAEARAQPGESAADLGLLLEFLAASRRGIVRP